MWWRDGGAIGDEAIAETGGSLCNDLQRGMVVVGGGDENVIECMANKCQIVLLCDYYFLQGILFIGIYHS